MTKPWGDLDHTLTLAPLARDIYLLSSQRAETGAIKAMVNMALLQGRIVPKGIAIPKWNGYASETERHTNAL